MRPRNGSQETSPTTRDTPGSLIWRSDIDVAPELYWVTGFHRRMAGHVMLPGSASGSIRGRSTLPAAPLAAGCHRTGWGCPRRSARPRHAAISSTGVRCNAHGHADRQQPPTGSRRREHSASAGSHAHLLTAGTQPLRHSVVLRVASIDEEQYTDAEAREEFEASTRRQTGRPASQHDSSGNRNSSSSSSSSSNSNSSSSNGSGQELEQESASGSLGNSEPFRLDTGQLAKLNGLTADEVFTSGIISSAQARPAMTSCGSSIRSSLVVNHAHRSPCLRCPSP